MGSRSFVPALALAVAASSPLFAHDFWIEPSTFRPEAGSLLTARLFVGKDFAGDPLPRDESHILRFVLEAPAGESRMIGAPGRDPAGIVRVESSGPHVIAYQSSETTVELSPDLLATYVHDEGLEPFFRGDLTKPIRDHFSRCAKALVLAEGGSESHDDPRPADGERGRGRAPSKGFDRMLGCPLELVPETNPSAPARDGATTFRLLREKKPLAGALVVAMERDRPERTLRARTDARGRVRFTMPPGPGVWLVKSVWMRPLSGKDNEWESFWASLTFEASRPPGEITETIAKDSARGGNPMERGEP